MDLEDLTDLAYERISDAREIIELFTRVKMSIISKHVLNSVNFTTLDVTTIWVCQIVILKGV